MAGRQVLWALQLVLLALVLCSTASAADLSDSSLFLRKAVSAQLPVDHPRLARSSRADPVAPEQVRLLNRAVSGVLDGSAIE